MYHKIYYLVCGIKLFSHKIVNQLFSFIRISIFMLIYKALLIHNFSFFFSLCSISVEGCIVVLGFSSRKIPQILASQLLPKSCALIGVSLTHYQKMVNETYRSSVQEIIDMYLEDFIDPHVAETFKLKDVSSFELS